MTILPKERYKPNAYRVNAFSFDLRHFLPLGGNLYYPVGENRLEGKIAKNKVKQLAVEFIHPFEVGVDIYGSDA